MNAADPGTSDVLRPWELLAVFLVVFGTGSVATAIDAHRASFTMQLWALPLILLSGGAIGPYLGSAFGMLIGTWSRVIGVRTARAGLAGFAAAWAIAVALLAPGGFVAGTVLLAGGVVVLIVDRRRHARTM